MGTGVPAGLAASAVAIGWWGSAVVSAARRRCLSDRGVSGRAPGKRRRQARLYPSRTGRHTRRTPPGTHRDVRCCAADANSPRQRLARRGPPSLAPRHAAQRRPRPRSSVDPQHRECPTTRIAVASSSTVHLRRICEGTLRSHVAPATILRLARIPGPTRCWSRPGSVGLSRGAPRRVVPLLSAHGVPPLPTAPGWTSEDVVGSYPLGE